MTLSTITRPLAGAATALALALAFSAPGAAQDETPPAPPATDLTGEWVLTVELTNGAGSRAVEFVQDGNELTGTIASSMASGDLTGTIDGDQVNFSVVLAMETQLFKVSYSATWRDGMLVDGTVDLGDYGSGTFTGERVQ